MSHVLISITINYFILPLVSLFVLTSYIITINYRTFRTACPAFVQFRASKDSKNLIVVKMNSEHNHEIHRVSHVIQINILTN